MSYSSPSLRTGDSISVTTPETWDSVTRKWKDNVKLLELVKLLLIDEVHLLSEPSRGATLEVVVSRMKLLSHIGNHGGTRIIAISATIANIEDIASWLCDSYNHSATVKIYGEDYRPVPLEKHVIGIPFNSQNPYQMENFLSTK